MRFHLLADLFPLLEGEAFAAFVEDIRTGLIEEIVCHEGKILDGRNRYRACLEAGIEPRYRTFGGRASDGDDPLAFVISANVKRRHLNPSQLGLIAAQLATMPQGARTDLNLAPIGAMSNAEAAKLFNVGEGTVDRAKRVLKECTPEVIAEIERGERSVASAVMELKQAEQRAIPAPDGLYDVVVIDPPWPMEKIKRDCRPNQVEFDYPVMTLEEIAALEIPAADDCHLFLWTTQKFMPAALGMLERWGFRYMFQMTWHKPGGVQPVGLPQYNSEFVLYGRKGSPHFSDTKAFPTSFEAPRGAHSEKPQAFYDLIERVTYGKRIDMFARQERPGFEAWGNEIGKLRAAEADDFEDEDIGGEPLALPADTGLAEERTSPNFRIHVTGNEEYRPSRDWSKPFSPAEGDKLTRAIAIIGHAIFLEHARGLPQAKALALAEADIDAGFAAREQRARVGKLKAGEAESMQKAAKQAGNRKRAVS